MQRFQKLKNATIMMNLINRGENSDVVLRESGGGGGRNGDLEVDVNVLKCQINKRRCH